MTRFADGLQRFAEWTIGLALAAMVVMVFGNAAGRYIFGQGLPASEELSRLAFVWLIMIGAVIAVRGRAHIGMDFVVIRLPKRWQRACLVVSNLLILYALWLLAKGGWTQTWIGLYSRLPVTGVPTGLFAAAGLCAALAMIAFYAAETWRALTDRLSDADLIQVRESAEENIRESAASVEDRKSQP
jgi:TRAP-type C4-dicarboxylate transport system permease small subunit